MNKEKNIKRVTAKEARQNFSDLLNEVYFGGKKVIITRSGKELVVLVSVKDFQGGET